VLCCRRTRLGRDGGVRGRAIGSPVALAIVEEQHSQPALLLVVYLEASAGDGRALVWRAMQEIWRFPWCRPSGRRLLAHVDPGNGRGPAVNGQFYGRIAWRSCFWSAHEEPSCGRRALKARRAAPGKGGWAEGRAWLDAELTFHARKRALHVVSLAR
jgi:hypothetical protein